MGLGSRMIGGGDAEQIVNSEAGVVHELEIVQDPRLGQRALHEGKHRARLEVCVRRDDGAFPMGIADGRFKISELAGQDFLDLGANRRILRADLAP